MSRSEALQLIDQYFAVDYKDVPADRFEDFDEAVNMMIDEFRKPRPTACDDGFRAAYAEGFKAACEEMKRRFERG